MERPAAARHEVSIERVVPGGEGLGRVSGVVALVSGALPGDRVVAEISLEGKRLLRGRTVEIVSGGPHRREENEICPRAADGSCGGCDWPSARPESAEALKTGLVLDALRRIGGLERADLPSARFVPSPPNYRLRSRLHLDRDGRLGFFAPRSNQIASNLEACEILSKPFLERLPAVGETLRALGPLEGELSTLEDRDGTTLLGELRLGRGARPKRTKKAGRGCFEGLRVLDAAGRILFEDGPPFLHVVAGGASFKVSVSSFFQGNRFLLDEFLSEIRLALGTVRGKEGNRGRPIRALDLYAGVGFLTRPLVEVASASGGEVVAVEVEGSAFRDLSENLRRWENEDLRGARAVRSTAEAYLSSSSHSRAPGSLDVVLADPPRAGLSPVVRRHLLCLLPKTLVMVSCDPPTLARDLGALQGAYAVDRLTLLDLFPGTHHVETVALLSRRT